MTFKQDLFWKNLPTKKRPHKLNANVHSLVSGTFLQDHLDPFFIFTGTNAIDFDRITKDKKLCNKLQKKNISIFLYEPVSYYFTNNGYTLGYYSEFHNQYNYTKKLRAEELDSIQKFAKKINKIIQVNHCDYQLSSLLQNRYQRLDLQCRDIFLRQAASAFMPSIDADPNSIIKPFWCGNGRYTIHRHIIMCKLAQCPGNYSWFFRSDCNWDMDKNWVEKDIITNDLVKGNDILNQNDFRLDFEAKSVITAHKSGYYMPEGDFSQPNITYKYTFDQCFVAIINETRFAQPTANFSEKVIDAINYGKPFIVAGPPRTIEYIQQFGFKTFSNFWNEDYDQVENHSQRILRIFQLIDYISSLSIIEMREIYKKMLPILEHNRKILKDLPKKTQIINENYSL